MSSGRPKFKVVKPVAVVSWSGESVSRIAQTAMQEIERRIAGNHELDRRASGRISSPVLLPGLPYYKRFTRMLRERGKPAVYVHFIGEEVITDLMNHGCGLLTIYNQAAAYRGEFTSVKSHYRVLVVHFVSDKEQAQANVRECARNIQSTFLFKLGSEDFRYSFFSLVTNRPVHESMLFESEMIEKAVLFAIGMLSVVQPRLYELDASPITVSPSEGLVSDKPQRFDFIKPGKF